MLTIRWLRTVLLAGIVAACGGEEAREPQPEVPAVEPAGAGEGMGGMSGGMQMGGGMMEQMQAHMQRMQGMQGDSIRSSLPKHRQMVANMISQMNREMRDMNMAADAAWTATVDSLRQDLTRMPELAPGELAAMMPAHRARAERLMSAHREMMRKMGH